ncbi:unnamed protein product [marine sediment metagenome]|uniref:LarA-like N-terminal domain-containing protein n=1 Tax=marine sediment metagenome TaxID=412755 RepID=X0ZQ46_9ZZZZ
MLAEKSSTQKPLSDEETEELLLSALENVALDGKKVLVLIPDHTRPAPLGKFFRLLFDILSPRVDVLDYLIALGTHPPMTENKILELIGITSEERGTKYKNLNIFNHRWDRPETLRTIGLIPAHEVSDISGGLLREDVSIAVNKLVFDYDHVILVGPTLPNVVAGFSGGYKYFFPGISGPEFLHLFHWLGALLTNLKCTQTHSPFK